MFRFALLALGLIGIGALLAGGLGSAGAWMLGGVFFVGKQACEEFGIPLQGARMVLQGFGNVGSFAAQFFHEAGAKLIAVSDADGGLRNDKGSCYPGSRFLPKEDLRL